MLCLNDFKPLTGGNNALTRTIYRLITLPILAAYQGGAQAFIPAYDLPLTVSFIVLLVLESVADQQQWDFHTKKRDAKKKGGVLKGDVRRGFLTQGLWKYSRHPNFLCEQLMWWNIYAFGLVGCAKTFHWTFTGPALLTILFQISTRLTEWISAEKYPEYKAYQKAVPMLIPTPFPRHSVVKE